MRTVGFVPLLSVITAVHPPHVQWLEVCGSSILGQKLPPGWSLEWCVQLDGGAVFSHHDARVKVASNGVTLGAAQSRNLAVSRASGDVLMHLDADDVLLDGALGRILPLYADDSVSWVAVRVDDLVGQDVVKHPHTLCGAIKPGVVSSAWLSAGHLPFHSVAFTLRRDAFLVSGGYPALLAAEDVGLILAVSDLYPGFVVQDTLALYRKWPLQANAASSEYFDLRPLCIQLLTDAVKARQIHKRS